MPKKAKKRAAPKRKRGRPFVDPMDKRGGAGRRMFLKFDGHEMATVDALKKLVDDPSVWARELVLREAEAMIGNARVSKRRKRKGVKK